LEEGQVDAEGIQSTGTLAVDACSYVGYELSQLGEAWQLATRCSGDARRR